MDGALYSQRRCGTFLLQLPLLTLVSGKPLEKVGFRSQPLGQPPGRTGLGSYVPLCPSVTSNPHSKGGVKEARPDLDVKGHRAPP